jgi:hypothetical protein
VHPPGGSMIWMLDSEAAGAPRDLPEVKWSKPFEPTADGLLRSGAL